MRPISIFAIYLVAVTISFIIGTFLWPFTLNSWLVYLNHVPCVQWWHGGLLGICPLVNKLTIPAALVTWILSLCMADLALWSIWAYSTAM